MQFTPENETPLLEILAQMSPQSSKTTLRSWVKQERVTIDGRPVKRGDVVVKAGQKVEVGSKKHFLNEGIRILYEDQHLVIIDKPAGLLSVSTAFEKGDTAHSILKSYYRPRKIKVYVVHRLDQDTSGVMIYALSEECCLKLKALFEEHDIERIYTAIVEGKVESAKGTWQSYLYEDANYFVHTTEDPKLGKLAITHYKTLKSTSRFSSLEFKLETGRKNQIRVQATAHGHPVAGDFKYGAVNQRVKRMCLHATALGLEHPITEKKLFFTSPVPEIFHFLLNRGKKA